MVVEWADGQGHPLVFARAGGYTGGITMEELIGLHKLTVDAFG
jgi:hypothetical protein